MSGRDRGAGLYADQSLRISQEQRINPRLYQAMELVYLPILDLQAKIEQELSENPFLELSEADEEEDLQIDEEGPDDADDEVDWDDLLLRDREVGVASAQYDAREFYDRPAVRAPSLRDFLREQLGLLQLDERQLWIAEEILGNIGDDGLLGCSLDAVREGLEDAWKAIRDQLDGDGEAEGGDGPDEGDDPAPAPPDLDEVAAALEIVQSLDPPGVGARDLRESLTIQLERAGRSGSLVHRIVVDHFDDLARRRWGEMARRLGVAPREVQEAADELTQLSPRPGREHVADEEHYVVPDLVVEKVGDSHVVLANDTGLPRLQIARSYVELAEDKDRFEGDGKAFVVSKLNAAHWLLQAIEQRRQTILKVMRCIVAKQGKFFDEGLQSLEPLTLQEVADEIGMAESTVSRVTNEKYVQSPQGVHSLKFFFSGGLPTVTGDQISTRRVREMIRGLLADEDRRSPLTDQAIVDLLKSEGVKIARRTVAKYRDRLGLPPARMRRRV